MTSLRWRLLIAAMGMVLLTSAYYRIHTAAMLSETAQHFLASLSPEQKAKAMFPFADEERFNWHYIPKERKGLPLREMAPEQKHLAQALLSSALSQTGYVKASTIMSLEAVLREIEHDNGERRNPEKYYFSIFGEPAEKGTWGFRVEGHHVSLNLTMVNGVIAASPSFFGANPANVKQGPRAGLRALAREEDLGRALISSLTPDEKTIAIVSKTAYKDILTAASRQAALEGKPSGLPASKMTAKQRELLSALVEEYASNYPEPVAEARLQQARKAGNQLYFAWAGEEEPGRPHYYRVQSPAFLIEFDDTQDGANHIHSVWRDFDGDFGRDLLKEHYQSTPHTGQ